MIEIGKVITSTPGTIQVMLDGVEVFEKIRLQYVYHGMLSLKTEMN